MFAKGFHYFTLRLRLCVLFRRRVITVLSSTHNQCFKLIDIFTSVNSVV